MAKKKTKMKPIYWIVGAIVVILIIQQSGMFTIDPYDGEVYLTPTCSDSDGKDIHTKGTCTNTDRDGSSWSGEDYCFTDNMVHESYCMDFPNTDFKGQWCNGGVHDCPNGCKDGRCI